MLKNLFNRLFKSYRAFFLADEPLCRIEEIDVAKKIIIIYCRGIQAPIKFTFEEIMNDLVILSNLSPAQASSIGYYYGNHYHDLLNQKSKPTCAINFDLYLTKSKSHCYIQMLNRQNKVVFFDEPNQTTHTLHPMQILMTKNLIQKFNSLQACYIGILAGISNAQNARPVVPYAGKPVLKRVK